MDMGGWDVIYASSVDKLNQVLAASSSQLIPTFSYSNASLDLKFSGSFGPWEIQKGGTANRINLLVPIVSGTLSFPQIGNVSLDGVKPVLNLALSLIEGASGSSEDLKFDITANSTTPTQKSGEVYIANPDESGQLGAVAKQLITDWFGELFVQNKGKISFVFATVFTDPQGEPWLKPKATGISYFQSLNGDVEAIGIKTLTQSPWGPGGLAIPIDPSLLARGEEMFYALSQAIFMRNLLLPAAAKALGVQGSTLSFRGPSKPSQQDGCSIVNSGNISLPSVENAGTHYYPVLTHYEVVISNNQIITTGSGQFDITGLANAYVTFDNLRVVNEISYDSSKKKLGFKLVSKNSPSTDSHIPWYEKTITWIVPVVGLIVNAVMDIVVATIESSVENAIKGTGSLSVDSIQLDTAVWTGLKQFDVNEAELASALVIRGVTH